MDPKACVVHILQSVLDGDFTEAIHSVEELKEWRDRGGYMPRLDDILDALGV